MILAPVETQILPSEVRRLKVVFCISVTAYHQTQLLDHCFSLLSALTRLGLENGYYAKLTINQCQFLIDLSYIQQVIVRSAVPTSNPYFFR